MKEYLTQWTAPHPPLWDNEADLDGDEEITSTDLSIVTANPPTIMVNPTSLYFPPNVTTLSFTVWNSGCGTIDYTITSDKPWITIFPSQGFLGPYGSIKATFYVSNFSPK